VRRLVLLLGVVTMSVVFAAPAAATTTTSVSMAFTEQAVANFRQDCPVGPDGLCGNGVVLPFGHVTETIQFGAGCGGSCDVRTIYLQGASITSNEQVENGFCRGVCQPNPGGTRAGAPVGHDHPRHRKLLRRNRELQRDRDGCRPVKLASFHGHDHSARLS
jgi:hypothetical protein